VLVKENVPLREFTVKEVAVHLSAVPGQRGFDDDQGNARLSDSNLGTLVLQRAKNVGQDIKASLE